MKISEIVKKLEELMNEYGDMNIENSYVDEIIGLNISKQYKFADGLKEISLENEEKKEKERIIQFYLDRTKGAIEYSATLAAKQGKKSIVGYLGVKNSSHDDGSNCTIEMIVPKEKFDKKNYDYKEHTFGEDISYVEQLCDRIAKLIKNMGFTEFYIRPIKVMVKKTIRCETFFHGTKYEKVNDHMEYGIVIKLSWR